ncbi:hypothetical protein Noda2021_07340 [Candidatus Dependentiae bacterium Noda2021]|nr:hypothetical protein Noda2021_07340 [Candidatus Dependentiae bacterium Noda2021]
MNHVKKIAALSVLAVWGLHAEYSFDVNELWQPIHLHLGCGQVRLNSYLNIDFPPSEHTVQKNTAAELHADITKLSVPPQTIKEVRSHHVFEHFSRPIALALLCNWHQWLELDGFITIETPDFERSMKILVSDDYSYVQKQSTMRHIFGSHEAHWAVHWDGWYAQKFNHVLSLLGYEDIAIEYTQWKLCPNIIVKAKKKKNIDPAILARNAKQILYESLVDDTEQEMFKYWCDEFDRYFSH